jgi:hypothetical protein
MQVRIDGKLIRGKGIRCPNCGAIRFNTPEGMCCNSGKDSGYQYHCRKCGAWFIDTFDGRVIVDNFLTTVYGRKEVQPEEEKETPPSREKAKPLR